MVIGVIGSREFASERVKGVPNYDRGRKIVFDTLTRICGSKSVTGLVSGGARGPDSYGAEYARKHDIRLTEHIPVWERADGSTDRSAGYKRNLLIVRDASIILAFYDGSSSGTRHTMTEARKAGKKVYMVNEQGEMTLWDPS